MDEEFHVSVVVSVVADTEEACRLAEEGGVLAEQYLPGARWPWEHPASPPAGKEPSACRRRWWSSGGATR
ncbi:hypothetical protein [Actinoalloteichus caeruleus]|uniref:hypothetical protein n=1 Tax=Actinoalloteichus cyanogriseus TaxID=2893586 RepID=UPI000AE1692C|nr:hypothetical protein [Actinoalloteichus caeruleus]